MSVKTGRAVHGVHAVTTPHDGAADAQAMATVIPFPGRSVEREQEPRRLRAPRRSPRPERVRSCSRDTASGARLQLTRRGRIVVTALLMVLMTMGIVGGASLARGAGPDTPDTRKVLVQPGQTVWDIARRVDPDADVRETVGRIAELNGLRNEGRVSAGDTLIVPVG